MKWVGLRSRNASQIAMSKTTSIDTKGLDGSPRKSFIRLIKTHVALLLTPYCRLGLDTFARSHQLVMSHHSDRYSRMQIRHDEDIFTKHDSKEKKIQVTLDPRHRVACAEFQYCDTADHVPSMTAFQDPTYAHTEPVSRIRAIFIAESRLVNIHLYPLYPLRSISAMKDPYRPPSCASNIVPSRLFLRWVDKSWSLVSASPAGGSCWSLLPTSPFWWAF